MLSSETYAACAQLVTEFWGHLDRDDYGSMLPMLTEDAAWNRGKWREGREDIAASLAERPEGLFVRHIITNMRVEDADGGVLCKYYLSAFATREGKASPPPYPPGLPALISDQEALCVKTPEGWRLKRLGGTAAFRKPQPA